MDKKLKKYALSSDNRKKDSLDRLREYMFSGGIRKLSKRDAETLSKLDSVNQLLTTGYSISNCVKKIELDLNIGQAQAYKLIRDTHDLYGDIRQSTKKGKQYILEEMYMRGADKALEMNDLHAYAHFLDSISRINGLFDTGAININMQQLQMPQLIMMDSKLETLKAEMEAQKPINLDE